MAQLIITKNRLKEKVGSGGFKPEALAKAQKSLDENTVDFIPIATPYIEEIKRIIDEYKIHPNPSAFARFLDPLMQLRAQGTFFKYPSISKLSDVVVDFLDSVEGLDSTIMEIIIAYHASANAVLKARLMDEKAPPCAALITELSAACNRYKAKQTGNGI
ncbi:MAG: hypothetical protein SFW65_04975 [Alphaproteobacteria bacterium]|nr:hypothetical protein [Alphaproteobacteria bacterium]